MNDIDKWFADKCGIDTCHNIYDNMDDNLYISGSRGYGIWSINDPKCREIIREKFALSMDAVEYDSSELRTDFCCDSKVLDITGGYYHSIKEAECACLLAIYESENP